MCFFKDNDKFYTSKKNAKWCLSNLEKILSKLEINFTFLEPSAGAGVFLDVLEDKGYKYMACDLYPEDKRIKKKDFLEYNPKGKFITIGNPPFGTKGKLALEFLNHACSFSPVIAFILPRTFKRYSVQRHVNKDFNLVFDKELPNNEFDLNGKNVEVKSVFQVWVHKDYCEGKKLKNLRLMSAPPTKHEDFEMYLHNNTVQTRKYFDKNEYEWDFAVHRQGYYDYNEFLYDEADLVTNRQYIFIKCKNAKVRKLIKSIDFDKLANKNNTTVPGFGKADLVEEYVKHVK